VEPQARSPDGAERNPGQRCSLVFRPGLRFAPSRLQRAGLANLYLRIFAVSERSGSSSALPRDFVRSRKRIAFQRLTHDHAASFVVTLDCAVRICPKARRPLRRDAIMRVLLVAAAGAAPARGLTQSAPGGFGAPLVRHVPVREELAALAPGRVLPFAPGDSRKRGPKLSRGATPANAAVERRKASAAGRTRGFARSAEGWCHPLRGEAPRDSRAYRRSASLHFFEAMTNS
jgi:hypothetical protein